MDFVRTDKKKVGEDQVFKIQNTENKRELVVKYGVVEPLIQLLKTQTVQFLQELYAVHLCQESKRLACYNSRLVIIIFLFFIFVKVSTILS